MSERVTITKFSVMASIVWSCHFCGKAIMETQSSTHHVSSSGHCAKCGAWYVINWHEQTEQSTVEMEREASA